MKGNFFKAGKTLSRFFFTLFAFALLGTSPLMADHDKPIAPDSLPAAAKTFIGKYFPDRKISFAKYEVDYLVKTYEAILSDGVKLEFSKKGEWISVDCRKSPVPEDIVPAEIRSYVSENYPGVFINEIKRSAREYEVDLSNRLELKFDAERFFVTDIDD